jgi:O-antigen/teichoic acid export membrane protein
MDFISMYIFVSDKEFGEYTAAYRLIEVYSVFVVTIILSMYPYMSLCNKKDRAIIASKILSLILLLSFIAILLFYFVGSIVIELFYGSEFSNISDIGMIILLTVIISNIVVLTTNLLLLMELEKIRLYRALIGLFTSLIIILPSTYLYGLMGAAISSTVVQLVLLVMSFYLKGSETINPILRDGVLFRNGISIWKK